MKFLPIERYTLLTKLSPTEVKALLEANVAYKSRGMQLKIGWSAPAPGKPYEGVVEDNRFEISRIIDYRNSFLPVIIGEVSDDIVHTAVRIRMRLNIAVAVFMLFWFTGVTVGFIVFLILLTKSLFFGGKFEVVMLVPMVMLVFGFLLVNWGFRSEANKSRKFLQALLNGWEEGQI